MSRIAFSAHSDPSAGGGGQRRGRRGRGGSAARRDGAPAAAAQMAQIDRNIPDYALFGEEGLALIEANADRLLEEIGVDISDDPETIELFRGAGAEVDGCRLRFARGLLRERLKTAPRIFVQHARNPQRSVTIGGRGAVFAPVYGPPFIRTFEGGRRYAKLADFQDIVKLVYALPSLHHSGGTVCEPVDVPVNKRHLDMVRSHIVYSDKPFMGSVTAPERAEDSVAMAKLVFGEQFVDENCVLINLINANSPLTFDATMLGALKVYARAGQACVVSPFILSGAMAPVTPVGVLTQTLAEFLVGGALTQIVRPGAPVVFGSFASSMSMQSGAPTFGTPEPAVVLFGAGQLARRIGVPFRSGGALCASKLPDAQAAYESLQTLYPTLLGGVNFVLHSAGWLEGGLASCPEKIVLDADQLGMLQRLSEGPDFSANGQALDAFEQVGPGSHFLGCPHTQSNFRTAFYRSATADNNSFEQWEADGAMDSFQRASGMVKRILSDYQAPALDPGIAEAVDEFVRSRKAATPDSWIS